MAAKDPVYDKPNESIPMRLREKARVSALAVEHGRSKAEVYRALVIMGLDDHDKPKGRERLLEALKRQKTIEPTED